MTKPQGTVRRHAGKLIALIVLSTLAYLAMPVYGFYSHRGEVPLAPWGWDDLPTGAPQHHVLHNEKYKVAASNAMKALEAQRQKVGAASYSAAVAIDGELVWAGATGWADVAGNVPATPATIYRIGSTSKAVTATALARMVQAGAIDLDAPISTYLSPLPNTEWKDITARQLASHMAGLPHYAQKDLEQKDWPGIYRALSLNKQYDRMADALENFDGASLRSKPGTEFYYSSQGTVLLGAVMAAAAGKPYMAILNQEVFTPLGMNTTLPTPENGSSSKNIAHFYLTRTSDDGTPQVRDWRDVNLSHRLPGGGLASTPSDLVRMGLGYFDNDYLSPGVKSTFWTPQVLANGEINEQGYALGFRIREWDVEGVGKVWNANHGGVSRGSQSFFMIVPQHGMVISFTANLKTDHYADFGMVFVDLVQEFVSTSRRGEG